MKKLILVTLMAAAASWLLAEARRPELPSPPRAPRPAPIIMVDQVQDRPDEPGSIRTVPWRKGDGPRSKRPSAPAPFTPAPKQKPKQNVPSWFPKPGHEEEALTQGDASGARVIVGRVSASEERARQDLRQTVERAVGDWLAADVATSWKVPARVLDAMVEESYTQETTRNLIAPSVGPAATEILGVDGLYTLYRAGQKLDFSASRKYEIVRMYRRELASQRLHRLGGGLALALVTLAVVSGYIKADEATKGYYTNRLRLVAAAGLGAAGVVAYRFLA